MGARTNRLYFIVPLECLTEPQEETARGEKVVILPKEIGMKPKEALQLVCPSLSRQQKEPRKQTSEASQPLCGEGSALVLPGPLVRKSTVRISLPHPPPHHRDCRLTWDSRNAPETKLLAKSWRARAPSTKDTKKRDFGFILKRDTWDHVRSVCSGERSNNIEHVLASDRISIHL